MKTKISSFKQRRVEHGWRSKHNIGKEIYYDGNVHTPYGLFCYTTYIYYTHIYFICGGRQYMWTSDCYMTQLQISRQVGKLCKIYF